MELRACFFGGAIQSASNAIGRVWLLALVLGFSLPVLIDRFDQRGAKVLDVKFDGFGKER